MLQDPNKTSLSSKEEGGRDLARPLASFVTPRPGVQALGNKDNPISLPAWIQVLRSFYDP